MKLSVLMITKNAKEVIEEALKSLKGLWDEPVIIDSGSKDGTLEIAKKFTNNVSSYPFQDNYSDVRNIGLSKVTGNWILVLDADERLSEELKRKISVLINDRNTDGYWFRRKTFISTKEYLRYGLFYPDWQLRLFRNKRGYYFKGAVHEQLTIPKRKTKEMPYDILHYPQHPKYTAFTDFSNLMPYVHIHADNLVKSSNNILLLCLEGMAQFVNLFFGGFLRGKGFLDGWNGFRAHLIFASSIALAYILAGWEKTKIALK
ncbi:MAG: Beta 1,4 glucosyltransferase [Candidatus Gottesmanbacteria bacterium GW2011_GWA2_47_9]|uniref:Beta 1,4 glucosyltransferase n=1 Tax=Candidatus Gottesmanbacteria bacterium GW2011_GWA2_47_9 TaxID=1618445 RepID=A0A0G1WCV6_9BACT|nr:MAG: Beta 1,4 glucosyltransferase [Candidatus Gottesmanbacteria bacterium GW2011_GWA2_47_9]